MKKAINFINYDVKIPLKIPIVDYNQIKETPNPESILKPSENNSGFLGSIGLSR